MAFTPNGEYLLSCGQKSVQVWRVNDGKHVATMPAEGVWYLAASQDGRWIAGATTNCKVLVWNAVTYKQLFADLTGWKADFSPDSTRLISPAGNLNTATIWDLATCQKVRTLDHDSGYVLTARYSPQGGRIATASTESVRVWDSKDGRLLVDIKVPASGLIWGNSDLFVITRDSGTIKRINAATGSTIYEWPFPDADSGGWSMDVPQHGKFITCAAKKTITFRDTVAHSQSILIQHTHDIQFISCSSDGQLLAFAAESKIVVKDLSSIVSHFVLVRFAPYLQSIFTASQSLYIPGSRP